MPELWMIGGLGDSTNGLFGIKGLDRGPSDGKIPLPREVGFASPLAVLGVSVVVADVTDSLYKRLDSTLRPLSGILIGGSSGERLDETLDSSERRLCG
jgi:hypothetical protein